MKKFGSAFMCNNVQELFLYFYNLKFDYLCFVLSTEENKQPLSKVEILIICLTKK